MNELKFKIKNNQTSKIFIHNSNKSNLKIIQRKQKKIIIIERIFVFPHFLTFLIIFKIKYINSNRTLFKTFLN